MFSFCLACFWWFSRILSPPYLSQESGKLPEKRSMPKQKRPPRPVPDDYICAACQEKGHWVYDCPQVSC